MWERRAERLMRGPRGLHTRLRAGGVSDRQAERALGLAPKTVCRWGCRGSYPRFAHAIRLRALVSDLSRGMDLSRVPDGFYAGAERPDLSAWLEGEARSSISGCRCSRTTGSRCSGSTWAGWIGSPPGRRTSRAESAPRLSRSTVTRTRAPRPGARGGVPPPRIEPPTPSPSVFPPERPMDVEPGGCCPVERPRGRRRAGAGQTMPNSLAAMARMSAA